jgi:hypothetical protein
MKIKELLDKKIDLKTLLLTGPFSVIYDIFSRRVIKAPNNTNIVYDVRKGEPVVISNQKYVGNYFNHSNLKEGIGIDSIKFGMKREICEEIMKSDLFEWSLEETPMGKKIVAKIIVNKFKVNFTD